MTTRGSSIDSETLLAWFAARVSELAGRPIADFDPDEPFSAYGLDSLKLSQIAGDLESSIGRRLDPTVLFEHPSASLLAAHLALPGVRNGAAEPQNKMAEPIAIIGIACRMPGADNVESFWRLLEAGSDAVTEVPIDRWNAESLYDPDPETLGRTVSRCGAFLNDIAMFDAVFFRISEEEARRMDPQQRLLLETCWDALENAGELPERLRGSAVGVFVGVSANDYLHRQLSDRATIGRYTATANSAAIAANRISYFFDFRGPSLAVDTACSSSLVAAHLACRALRDGECERAVVGGVNLLLDPEITIALSKAGMLAPDGRCKAFDAYANGYVRGEGCGVIVLKPLSAALAAGDRIYAVIRGSAVNQDGKSNGLTAPNPAAQRAVLRAAYRSAGIEPGTVQYVECHGSGTLLGDPIEARSLSAVVGDGRAGENPCLIGSVKTNIGHLEAAAGIAGIIKLALMLQRGRVVPSLHFNQPNPHIPFADLNLRVVTQASPWPCPNRRRIAGVSSFGFGGTNAHLVLEEAPAQILSALPGPVVLPISARTRAGLEQSVKMWAARLSEVELGEITALALAATMRRTHHHPFRVALAAENPLALRERLRDLERRFPNLPPSQNASVAGARVAFVFSGQGSQWSGMARDLLENNALFTSTIRRCDAVLSLELGWSIEAVLRGQDSRDFNDTAVASPLLVAVQFALAQVWRSIGIEPRAVVGHSLGEMAAALTAGLLDFESGMRLAVLRGRLIATAPGNGRMMAVRLSRDEAEREAERYSGKITLAAVNSPDISVLAGDAGVLEKLYQELADRNIAARWLNVNYAFHSPNMQAASDALTSALQGIVTHRPSIPFYSTVLGRKIQESEVDAAYWGRGVCVPVEFEAAVTSLLEEGIDAVIEIGPQPVLATSLRQIADAVGKQQLAILHSLDRNHRDRYALLHSLCRLYAMGCQIHWDRMFPYESQMISLPPHPWERRKHWIPRRTIGTTATPDAKRGLLGEQISVALADERIIWQSRLSNAALPCLADHSVRGVTLFPASAYVDLAATAAAEAGLTSFDITSLGFHSPFVLGDEPVYVQTTLTNVAHDRYQIAIHSCKDDDEPHKWVLHVTATLGSVTAEMPRAAELDVCDRCRDSIAPALYYDFLRMQGFDYGPSFRGLHVILQGDAEAIGEIAVPVDNTSPGTERVRLLDSAFQLIAAAAGIRRETQIDFGPYYPAGIHKVHWVSAPTSSAKAHVRLQKSEPEHLVADLDIFDDAGNTCIEIVGLEVRRVAIGHETSPVTGQVLRFYEPQWQQRDLEQKAERGVAVTGHWLVFADESAAARNLLDALDRMQIDVITCRAATSFAWIAPKVVQLDPWRSTDYERLIKEITDKTEPLVGVVHLWGLDQSVEDKQTSVDSATSATPSVSLLHLIQALSFSAKRSIKKLIVATRGCQPVEEHRFIANPFAATMWGLMKTVAIENPLLPFLCVDLDPEAKDAAVRLCDEIVAETRDTEVAWRRGLRFVRRLIEVPGPTTSCDRGSLPILADAIYVILGGTGALGLRIAEHLVERGARHVALLARGPATTQGLGLIDTMSRAGADIRLVATDIRDRTKLACALEGIRALGLPIQGVIHAAGVLDDAALFDMTAESLVKVLEPKILGSWNLHELTLDDPLDWFVLFSSAAGLLGAPGQANYSAANAYLDALAHYRRHLGLPAISIDWGPFAESGMASVTLETPESRRLRLATSAIDPRRGAAIFERLISQGSAQTAVLSFDLRNLLQFYPAGPGTSFFDEISEGEPADLKARTSGAAVRPELATLYVGPRSPVEQRIATVWQNALGIEPIGVFDSFFELGGDSVFANRMLIEMNRALGVSIDPELAFGRLTVADLAALAEEQMQKNLMDMSEGEAEERFCQSMATQDS